MGFFSNEVRYEFALVPIGRFRPSLSLDSATFPLSNPTCLTSVLFIIPSSNPHYRAKAPTLLPRYSQFAVI